VPGRALLFVRRADVYVPDFRQGLRQFVHPPGVDPVVIYY